MKKKPHGQHATRPQALLLTLERFLEMTETPAAPQPDARDAGCTTGTHHHDQQQYSKCLPQRLSMRH